MRKICYFGSTLHEMDTKSIARLKGKHILQNVEKTYNFRIKSETGKWSVRGKLT
jgi:hypothetical protein